MNGILQTKRSSTTGVRIRSIGASVPGGRYSVHSRFEKIINLKATDRKHGIVIALTCDRQLESPVNIIASGLNLRTINSLTVEADRLTIGSESWPLDRIPVYHGKLFNGAVPEEMSSQNIPANLSVAVETVTHRAPEFSLAVLLDKNREKEFQTGFQRAFLSRMQNGADLLFSNNPAEGVKKLRRCGFGLTPSGDDFLCGLLFALDFLEKTDNRDFSELREIILQNSAGGAELTATFLSLAGKGEYHASIREAALSLLQSNTKKTEEAFTKAMDSGETSGADLVSGFLLSLLKLKPNTNSDYNQGAQYAD